MGAGGRTSEVQRKVGEERKEGCSGTCPGFGQWDAAKTARSPNPTGRNEAYLRMEMGHDETRL